MEQFQIDAKTELLNQIDDKLNSHEVVEAPRPRRFEISLEEKNKLLQFRSAVESAGDNANYLMAKKSYPILKLALRDLG